MQLLRDFKKIFLSKFWRGFTMIEVLIVILILGVLASVAVPVYQSSTRKATAAEALKYLEATRASMQRYYLVHAPTPSYSGANILAASCNLDFCPNGTTTTTTIMVSDGCGGFIPETTTNVTGTAWIPGAVPKFTYSFSVNPNGDNYTLRAVYTGVGATAADWINLSANGDVVKNGIYL